MNLTTLLLLSSALINLQIAIAESPSIPLEAPTITQVPFKWDKVTIPLYIENQATQNGIEPQMALHVAKNESRYRQYVVGDGHLTCKKTGLPIRSRGIWQINNCAWSEITDEQAFDVVWSTQWAMAEMKKNGCKIWSTCVSYQKE